ncbi:MAG TPA: flagellar biosynthetic protein FliO [Hyphomicrobiaceae bacterium]|nr:flagellar biosynthetic protein FliO [Hyphomicrobiaceae bacterium]
MLTWWVVVLVLAAIALVVGAFLARNYMNGTSLKEAVFRPRPEKRLAVVEQASVDGRRKLILVKRDGVEHLIMTGGPVDVVIETGIGAPPRPRQTLPANGSDAEAPAAPVFTRAPRPLGQAVNE